jgi:hypothetical protein
VCRCQLVSYEKPTYAWYFKLVVNAYVVTLHAQQQQPTIPPGWTLKGVRKPRTNPR